MTSQLSQLAEKPETHREHTSISKNITKMTPNNTQLLESLQHATADSNSSLESNPAAQTNNADAHQLRSRAPKANKQHISIHSVELKLGEFDDSV